MPYTLGYVDYGNSREKTFEFINLKRTNQCNSFKDGIEISYKPLNQSGTCKNISDEISGFFFGV